MQSASLLRVLFCILLLLVVAFPVAAVADEPLDFRQTVTFGDSLTDNALLDLFFTTKPGVHGTDPFEAVFRKGARDSDKLRSFAVVNVKSTHIPIQLLRYDLALVQRKVAPATFFGFEFGGNDALENLALLASAPPFENQEADDVIDRLIHNYAVGLENLESRFHPAKIVLWNVTDVTLTPYAFGYFGETGDANIRAHVERANEFIQTYDGDPDKIVLDLYGLLQESVVNPPVILGHPLQGPPAFGDFDNLFADPIHPTAVGNAIIANEIIQRINAKWGNEIPFYSEEELAKLARIPRPTSLVRGSARSRRVTIAPRR